MSDPTQYTNPHDSNVEEQDGAVRDVDDPSTEQDTASGGAPDEPDDSDKTGGTGSA